MNFFHINAGRSDEAGRLDEIFIKTISNFVQPGGMNFSTVSWKVG